MHSISFSVDFYIFFYFSDNDRPSAKKKVLNEHLRKPNSYLARPAKTSEVLFKVL